MQDYNSKLPKRKSCFHCGGKLIPTNNSDVMSNMGAIIDIQIYRCIDCHQITKIPTRADSQTSIADEIPDSISIQRLVLKSNAFWDDTVAVKKAIDRLKAMTGENSLGWQLSHARWLLVTDQSDKSAAQAANITGNIARHNAVP